CSSSYRSLSYGSFVKARPFWAIASTLRAQSMRLPRIPFCVDSFISSGSHPPCGEDILAARLPHALRAELGKQVPEDRIALDVNRAANEMARGVEAPRALVGHDRAVHKVRRHPVRIEQVADGCDVPYHLRPREGIVGILTNDPCQVRADRAAGPDIPVQLGDRRQQMARNAHARNMHQRYAAVEQNPGARNVLVKVELLRVRPVEGMAA